MADNELEILLKAKDEASKEIEKIVSAVKELEASLEKIKAEQLGAVGDSALKSVDGLEQVSSAAKKSADAIASLAEATKTPLSDISGDLGDGAKKAGASLDELGTSISGLEQEVGSPIPDPTEDLKEGARETAGIVSGLSEDISDLKSSSDINVPDSTEVLREGAEETKETLSELSTTLSGLGDGDQVGDPTSDLREGAGETKDSLEELQGTLGSLVDSSGDTLPDVSQDLRGGLESTEESASSLADQVSSLRGDLESGIQSPFDDLQEGAETTSGALDSLVAGIQTVSSEASDEFSDPTETLRQGAEDTVSSVEELGDEIEQIQSVADSSIGSPFDDVEQGAEEAAESVGGLGEKLKDLQGESQQGFGDPTEEMRQGAEETESYIDRVKARVAALREEAKNSIEDPSGNLREGAENASKAVSILSEELGNLQSSSKIDVPDSTEKLRQGAEDSAVSVGKLVEEIDHVQRAADGALENPFDKVNEGAEQAAESAGKVGEHLEDLQKKSKEGLNDPTEEMREGAKKTETHFDRVRARVDALRASVSRDIPNPFAEVQEGSEQTTEALRKFLKELGSLTKTTKEMLNDPTQAFQLGIEVAEGYARSLKEEIMFLRGEVDKEFDDPTAPLREGSDYANASLSELESELEALKRAASQPLPDVSKDLSEGADEAAENLEKLSAKIAKIVAAAAGLGTIGAILKRSAGEIADETTYLALLENQIKNTGRASEITAKEILAMTDKLALSTLASTAGMEKAAAKLLTFKEVATTSFEDILVAAQDMAASGFGSLEANAARLGKAFADPKKAVALFRLELGTFPKGAKEAIDSMVDMGDQAGAQAKILEVLAARFEGAGKAAKEGLGGELDTLTIRLEELHTAIGEAIEPALIAFFEELNSVIVVLTRNMEDIIEVAKVLGFTLLLLSGKKVLTSLVSLKGALVGVGVATAKTTTVLQRLVAVLKRTPTSLVALKGALIGVGVSATKTTTVLKGLTAALKRVPFVAWALGISFVIKKLWDWNKASREAAEEQKALAINSAAVSDWLGELSHQTGLSITTQEEYAEAIRNGSLVLDEQTGKHLSAAQAAKKFAKEQEEIARQTRNFPDVFTEAGNAAADLQEQFDAQQKAAHALADGFRVIAAEVEKSDAAVRKVVGGINLANSADLGALLQSIDILKEEASGLADVIFDEVVGNLKKLNSGDLLAFGRGLIEQFDLARTSAENFARLNNEVLAQSFKNLGTSYSEAITGISAQSQTAVDSVATIQAAMERANLSTDQFRVGMEAAISAAIPKTDSVTLLQELRDRITSLGEAGQLSSTQVQRLNEKLDDQFRVAASLDPAVRRLEEAYRELGLTSPKALQDSADAAKESLETLVESGATLDTLKKAFEEYAARAVAANEGVLDSTLKVKAAALGLTVSLNESGDVIVRVMGAAAAETDKFGGSLDGAKEGAKELATYLGALKNGTEAAATATQNLSKAQRELIVAEIRRELGELSKKVAEGTITQDEYAKSVRNLTNALRELQKVQQEKPPQGPSPVEKLADDVEKVETNTRKTDKALGGLFTGIINRAADAAGKWSEAAKRLFHELRGATDQAKQMGDAQALAAGDVAALRKEVDGLESSLAELRKPVLGTNQTAGFANWLRMTTKASVHAQVAYLNQRLAMESLIEGIEAGSVSLKNLERASESANQNFDLLDNTSLSRLHSAIDGAISRMAALKDSTETTLTSLQDELLRLQGNEDELAARRLAQREQELRDQIDEAKAVGAKEAVANLQQSLGVLTKIGEEESRQREQRKIEQAERDQAAKANAASTGSDTTTVRRYEAPAPATVHNTPIYIEGVLDMNDRVTLENLARKLGPMLTDIQRRRS